MKKIQIGLFFFLIVFSINVMASSGAIKQDSVIECNNIYYGNHGNPLHWHQVIKKDNKWVIASGEVSIPACYIKKANVMEKVLFSKCGDGDTARFIINNEERKVRFLAIDTMEVNSDDEKTKVLGKKASDYTCNVLREASEIYLEYDGNSDKEDKYGRVLAFVYVDGVLLEKSLVEEGLARVYYIYGDYAHVDELREIEEAAKAAKKGIWSDDNTPDVIEENENNSDSNEENNALMNFINVIIQIVKKIFALF